jgi:hypothetical protein
MLWKKLIVSALAVVALALGVSCSMSNIGGVRKSPEVTRQFEALEANPNYRYWYLNQENNPFGVAGLDREYRLRDDPIWRPVEADSASFRKVVGLVQSFPVPNSYTSGFAITDPQGRQIGVWYSSLPAGITADPQTGIVSITTMMPWVFNDNF